MGDTANELGMTVQAPLSPDAKFTDGTQAMRHTALDFWQWAMSDLVNNANRGMLAEYLVALDLGVGDCSQAAWDAYDLVSPEGVFIEVKTSGYCQAWTQSNHSVIEFGIAPKTAWSPVTNKWTKESRRWSDVFIFSIHHHMEKATLNPMDVSQWTFYVLPTSILNEQRPEQKTMRLSVVKKLGAMEVRFGQIGDTIRGLFPDGPPPDGHGRLIDNIQ